MAKKTKEFSLGKKRDFIRTGLEDLALPQQSLPKDIEGAAVGIIEGMNLPGSVLKEFAKKRASNSTGGENGPNRSIVIINSERVLMRTIMNYPDGEDPYLAIKIKAAEHEEIVFTVKSRTELQCFSFQGEKTRDALVSATIGNQEFPFSQVVERARDMFAI